jgi:hypothetical protein
MVSGCGMQHGYLCIRHDLSFGTIGQWQTGVKRPKQRTILFDNIRRLRRFPQIIFYSFNTIPSLKHFKAVRRPKGYITPLFTALNFLKSV